MLFKKYNKNYHDLVNDVGSSKRFLVAFLAITIVLVGLLATRKPVVTVVPWTLTSEAQVFSDDASQSYKEAWAMAIAILIGNVQPSNVGFIADRLKPLLAPGIYHETIDAIHANAQQLIEERVSMRFEPRQVIYEKTTGKLFVYGSSFARMGTSLEQEIRSERTYEMKLKIDNYAPMLMYITTYTGTPMTQDAIDREEKKAQREEQRQRKAAQKAGIRYVPKEQ